MCGNYAGTLCVRLDSTCVFPFHHVLPFSYQVALLQIHLALANGTCYPCSQPAEVHIVEKCAIPARRNTISRRTPTAACTGTTRVRAWRKTWHRSTLRSLTDRAPATVAQCPGRQLEQHGRCCTLCLHESRHGSLEILRVPANESSNLISYGTKVLFGRPYMQHTCPLKHVTDIYENPCLLSCFIQLILPRSAGSPDSPPRTFIKTACMLGSSWVQPPGKPSMGPSTIVGC